MIVISKRILNEFIDRESNAKDPVLRWYLIAKAADWSDFSELKKDMNATDSVGNGLYVFNIGGNKYRLIARIIFKVRTIYIRFIGTHKQYDKVKLSDL